MECSEKTSIGSPPGRNNLPTSPCHNNPPFSFVQKSTKEQTDLRTPPPRLLLPLASKCRFHGKRELPNTARPQAVKAGAN